MRLLDRPSRHAFSAPQDDEVGVTSSAWRGLIEGRGGGYRTLIACRFGDFAVFLFGFAKSERDNIRDDELRELRVIARQWLADRWKIEKDAACRRSD